MKQNDLQALLGEMTLAEKIGQLQQVTGDFYTNDSAEITGPLSNNLLSEDDLKNSGSVLGLSGATDTNAVQKKYLENNRLHIPLLFMADIVHGYRTIFPIPLGLATSWNPELVKETAAVAAKESAVSGLHVTFSPMVDLVRDPRWGRVMESTGEDPLLNCLYAESVVQGYQGPANDLINNADHIAACVKHFAAYGAPEGGREYNTVNMSDRELRENYLPSYQAAINAGSKLVMTSFNTIDGVPATVNTYLNRQILRDEFKFEGVLISDWAAMMEAINHGVAEDHRDVAKQSLKAGVDIEMMTFCYHQFVEELISAKEVDEGLLDEAVLRILELKNDLGLFENPYRSADAVKEAAVVYSAEHQQVALKAAEESIVLLENKDNVLPLATSEKVAFVGPFATSSDILGTWSWKGEISETASVADVLGTDYSTAKVTISPVADVFSVTAEELAAAKAVAKNADKVVVLLGETSQMSGEASSRTSIQLPEAQLAFLDEILSVGKPVIVVSFNGRPLDLSAVSEKVTGLVEAWFPGTKGATALLNILYGKVAPKARLTMSFPRNVGQIPVYYNHFNTGRPINFDDLGNKYVSKYLDVPNTPLYPFGYGLTYTTFGYDHFKVVVEAGAEPVITCQVRVKNTGQTAGTEIVQWYLRDIVGQVVRPMKELKGFDTVELQAGEERVVTHSFTFAELGYVHHDKKRYPDHGEFEVMVGSHSESVLTTRITL